MWAEAEFGHAQLGDARRTRRAVQLAALAAHQPAAFVTQLCADEPALSEAVYDFLENNAVAPAALAEAHHHASARRAAGARFLFVAVDGSSLAFDDEDGARGMGRIGTDRAGRRGRTLAGCCSSPNSSSSLPRSPLTCSGARPSPAARVRRRACCSASWPVCSSSGRAWRGSACAGSG